MKASSLAWLLNLQGSQQKRSAAALISLPNILGVKHHSCKYVCERLLVRRGPCLEARHPRLLSKGTGIPFDLVSVMMEVLRMPNLQLLH